MHIGLDGLALTAPKTGVGHYTFELAQALARVETSSQFELLYPSTYPPLAPDAFPDNLKFHRVQVGPVGRHWWSTGLPRHIRNSKLQLFHGTNYDVPLWKQCATVLTIHDLSYFLHPETHEQRSVRRARRRLPVMARSADAIITPTESVRREVCTYLKVRPEKVVAIPEAARSCFRPQAFAETADLREQLGVGDDFLLTVGTLEPRKNLSVLVSAFAEVARALPLRQMQLVIAGGKGWLSGPLFTLIERSPVRDRILLTDYLHDDELRALYASCRAFVYPSIYEGFGLPPLEAMACGAPVITSNIPALSETTGDAARLFDPQSVGDLAKNILELLDDEAEESTARRLSIVGQRHAAEFSWERTATETLKVYEEALKRFGRSPGGGR